MNSLPKEKTLQEEYEAITDFSKGLQDLAKKHNLTVDELLDKVSI